MTTDEQIKSAKAVLEQIISDVNDAGTTGDFQSFYERMSANRDDAERLVRDLLIPTRIEKAIEEARHYLCDNDDITVEEQVKRIAEADEEEMIENIEGIMEWEPIAGKYNAIEFLELINY